jgi:cobalt-zinc-cadmium efflux system protein
MGNDHAHGHATAAGAHRGRLAVVLGIVLLVLAIEVAGGLITGSLALLADAAHMASDAAGIGLILLAVWFAARPPTTRRTFGYQRLEILAAIVNAVVLLGAATLITIEAVRRLADPEPIETGLVLVFAAVGLVANGASLFVLRGADRSALAIRGAVLEVLADAFGSVAVIAGALVIRATGWLQADAVVSLLIAVLIVPRTLRLLKEAADVLLETAPAGVDMTHVREHILGCGGVVDVHDLHAWTITSGVPVLSAHVVVDEQILRDTGVGPVLDRLQACVSGHFDVEHSTFQIEPHGHRDHEDATHA